MAVYNKTREYNQESRYKFKGEKIPLKVVEIVQELAERPKTSEIDLELALRLRLKYEQIAYRVVYLLLLQHERNRHRRQEEEAFLLLH